ncbi:hypothetical protein WDZ92_27995 [Nostoc sp. NIES-2111]
MRNLPDKTIGRLEYYVRRGKRSSWGGPFNGQQQRCKIFKSIVSAVKIDAVIETGTYRGTTTRFIAENVCCPVYTAEYASRNIGFASEQLRWKRNVRLHQSDSRAFLKKIVRQLSKKTAFVYLDAHWFDDLPLDDELNILLSSEIIPIVMIDDFQVPDDPGYGYDDYGPGKALTIEYISEITSRFGVSIFFPSALSQEETGAKRGCAVLCNNSEVVSYLRSLPTLRELLLTSAQSPSPNTRPTRSQPSR